MSITETAPAPVHPAEPGSAVRLYHATPGRRHPAEVVVGALLRGRSVDLPDGRTYRLGEDLTLGTVGVGPDDETGYVVTRDLPMGEFLRLCEQLSYNELFLIGCDRVLAETSVELRRARARVQRQAAAAA
ncbi:MAG TPA: hypothetical protein VF541_06790 [Longimicrobium sp.]|jgi:hypothetical protein